LRIYLLILGIALYAGSLFAPSIHFKPDVRSNPKRFECSLAAQDDVVCESFPFGHDGSIVCQPGHPAPGKTYVDREKILQYCKGWDLPMSHSLYGYEVLLLGALGTFLGMFAWFSNPSMLLGLLLAAFGMRRTSTVLLLAAVALGLQSYALEGVPFNESSIEPDNLDFVDHLGLGFYLWMGSLSAFAAYCFLKREVSPTPRT
jgi:hypothetical protein